MDKFEKVIDNYIKMFGSTKDIDKYVSTWDYTEKDFDKLAEQIQNCVKCGKRYSKLYVSLSEKIYDKTIYKFLDFEE